MNWTFLLAFVVALWAVALGAVALHMTLSPASASHAEGVKWFSAATIAVAGSLSLFFAYRLYQGA
jgi:hypothetical protein